MDYQPHAADLTGRYQAFPGLNLPRPARELAATLRLHRCSCACDTPASSVQQLLCTLAHGRSHSICPDTTNCASAASILSQGVQQANAAILPRQSMYTIQRFKNTCSYSTLMAASPSHSTGCTASWPFQKARRHSPVLTDAPLILQHMSRGWKLLTYQDSKPCQSFSFLTQAVARTKPHSFCSSDLGCRPRSALADSTTCPAIFFILSQFSAARAAKALPNHNGSWPSRRSDISACSSCSRCQRLGLSWYSGPSTAAPVLLLLELDA